MSAPDTWIPHHREDGELVGWIEPSGEGFVPFDLFGRARSAEAIDWVSAEDALEEIGIGFLAALHAYRAEDGSWVQVRITELSTDGITVKEDDLGAVGVTKPQYVVPFPVDDRLVPLDEAPGPVRGPFD
ncbi:hypothetical protein JD292_10960 [Leucobacter sp. CSA2]|uniref:Uncharacterized protein n=1 Tax=Leucobacter edaphi TaxID=2796472 RepID=A0A934QER4_9MICO|nr:hypothetical protein [Leucobacter edaphi]MBK0422590.1 hypothetical protein [Leucobacter edaphi]